VRIGKKMTVIREVGIKAPDDHKPQTIRVQFLILDNERLETLQEPLYRPSPERQDGETAEDFAKRVEAHSKAVAAIPRNILREAVVGWPDNADIQDENGNPIPYSDEAKELLLSYEFAVSGLMFTYRTLTNPKR